MRRFGWLSLAVYICGSFATLAASETDFDRYQVILSRKPFGSFEERPSPPPPPPPRGPTWDAEYKLISVVAVENEKPKAGLLHVKTAKAIVLSTGEQENGIALLAVSQKDQSATFRKGTVEATFLLGQQGDMHANAAPVAAASKPKTIQERRLKSGLRTADLRQRKAPSVRRPM